MNTTDMFYRKVKIPRPNINWKNIWDADSSDQIDRDTRFKQYYDFNRIWKSDVFLALAKVDLIPRSIRIFRWNPNDVFPWHIDGNIDNAVMFAINWVLDGSGLIQWNRSIILNRPSSKVENITHGSKIGDRDDSIECQVFGDSCIVNTSIPHRVINLEKTHRVTASLIYKKHITYDEAIERLQTIDLIE